MKKIPCDCPKGGLVGENELLCEKCGGSEWIETKETTENWREEFEKLEDIPFHAEVMDDGTCSVDFTETNKFYKDFIQSLIDKSKKEEKDRIMEYLKSLRKEGDYQCLDTYDCNEGMCDHKSPQTDRNIIINEIVGLISKYK